MGPRSSGEPSLLVFLHLPSLLRMCTIPLTVKSINRIEAQPSAAVTVGYHCPCPQQPLIKLMRPGVPFRVLPSTTYDQMGSTRSTQVTGVLGARPQKKWYQLIYSTCFVAHARDLLQTLRSKAFPNAPSWRAASMAISALYVQITGTGGQNGLQKNYRLHVTKV